MTNETNYDTIFGKMAVDHGLCTDDELRRSLTELHSRREIKPVVLKDLMVELGFITTGQAERLKDDIKESKAAVKHIPGYKIISEDHVAAIERQLDELNDGLEPLANFILPGGSRLIAELHIARTVCRRAERRLVTLASGADINADGLKLLNRLSDYLFVAARYCAKVTGTPEILWEQG